MANNFILTIVKCQNFAKTCKLDLYENSPSFKFIAFIEKKLLERNLRGGGAESAPHPSPIRVKIQKT